MTNEPALTTVAWLIEVGSPPLFYCLDDSWCSNPNHACRFPSYALALEHKSTMLCMMEPRVTEHIWLNDNWHWFAEQKNDE